MDSRHAFRAKWHDYNDGAYFITICAATRHYILGCISDNEMHLSAEGNIVQNCVLSIPDHYEKVELWNHVVMPNHVHIILNVKKQNKEGKGNFKTGCLKPPLHGASCNNNHFNSRVAVIIRSFKAACTIEVNRWRRLHDLPPVQLWQRNYHEHIIRTQRSYENIMEYVYTNVERWESDCFY